jgi:curli biogenesis system outer membrane secretion channel CsgG
MKSLITIFALAVVAGLALAQGDNASKPGDKHLKLRIAVAPLDYGANNSIDNWQIPVEFRNAIDDKLAKKLFDTGRFIVLDRESMQPLLDEKAIKEDNTGQSQKGKTVPAQALVRGKLTDFSLARRGSGIGVNVGSLGRVGGNVTEAKVAMQLTMMDVDTSEILATEEAAGKANSTSFHLDTGSRFGFADFSTFESSPLGEATTKALDAAVQKILDKLGNQPWSARVADFDAGAKEVTINAGSDTGVQVGDTFDLMHISGIVKDPDTGEVLRVKTVKAGRVKIKDVEKKFAVADLIEGTSADVGDLVAESKS